MTLASLKVLCLILLLSINAWRATGVELTFELPDKARQCFHEEIEKGTKCTLEFQVRLYAKLGNCAIARTINSTTQ